MQDFGPVIHHAPRAPLASRKPRPRRARTPSIVGGRYELIDLIGKGGMGQVYRALQLDLQRQVALKVLPRARHGAAARDRELERRFDLEASFAAQLCHPHAVSVFDVGADKHHCFLAMELLVGQSVHRALRCVRLGAAAALEIGRQVGSAVSAAHELGALHRDLKPGNIMLLGAGDGSATPYRRPFAKLLDFGLAKQFATPAFEATEVGRKLGSPGYMSPEQVRGGAVDARSDVYGLGAVMFEMLAGQPAFRGSDPADTMRAHLEAPTPSLMCADIRGDGASGSWPGACAAPLHVSALAAIDALVQQALAKDPNARFATMASMVQAIEHVQALVASPVAMAPPQPRGESTTYLALPNTRGASAGVRPSMWQHSGRFAALHATRVLGHEPAAAPTSVPSRPSAPPSAIRHGAIVAGRTPWVLALMGAAVGLLGGAALRHAPRWHIESLPSRATVYWNEQKLCEQTPCTVRWHVDDIGRVGTLRFVREGFDDVLATGKVGRLNKTLGVTLEGAEAPGLSAPAPKTPR